jgi:hypothetical protein
MFLDRIKNDVELKYLNNLWSRMRITDQTLGPSVMGKQHYFWSILFIYQLKSTDIQMIHFYF